MLAGHCLTIKRQLLSDLALKNTSSSMTASVRRALLSIALLCFVALGIALASQHIAGMRPCAWCVLQRLILLLTGLAALLGWAVAQVRGVKARVACISAALMTGVLSISGIIAAWYQYSVAAMQFSCAQTFADRFMTGSGLDAMAPWLFGIYATCMDARVDLLGIEYALWGLGLFVVLTGISAFALIQAARR